MKVIQLCESLSYGDGMSNHALLIHQGLQNCGVHVETYSGSFNGNVPAGMAKPYNKNIRIDPDDLVLLQFGLGGSIAREVDQFKCRKMLYFHNVTSPHFFDGIDNKAALECLQGLKLVQQWAARGTFDAYITCSHFNRDCLVQLGVPENKICCVPSPLMVLPKKDEKPDPKVMEKYADGNTNILFVGRISPHKKQADVIRAFAYYQRHIEPGARLFLIGGGFKERYGQALVQYIESIGQENVIFPGHITDAEVLAFYHSAHVFLCMSEHEGFCQPLYEAMVFQIPIIAYAAAAIPDTLGNSGVLLSEKDPVLCAKWIERIRKDHNLREQILKGQNEQAQVFAHSQEITVKAIRNFAENNII